MSLHKVAGIVVVLICGSVAHAGPRSEPSRAATVYQVTLMYRLGVAYDEGLGVQSDSAAAYRWYSLAAAQGHAESMNRIGILYATGRGLPQDYVAALGWFRLAAANGSMQALNNVANAYFHGLGVPQSYAMAATLLKGAAQRGDAAAQYRLGLLHDSGLGVARDSQLARELFERSATQGYAPAMVTLGRIYVEAIGVPRDSARGQALLRAALDHGIPSELRELALFELGVASARLDEERAGATPHPLCASACLSASMSSRQIPRHGRTSQPLDYSGSGASSMRSQRYDAADGVMDSAPQSKYPAGPKQGRRHRLLD